VSLFMRGGDLEREQADDLVPPKRLHVTFAPLPPDFVPLPPRRIKSRRAARRLKTLDDDDLKTGFAHLRTPYVGDGWNFHAILWTVIALVILFILIWWVVDRLLLLEIEEQIKKPSRAQLHV
jgi:hypothetical protein